MTIAVFAAGVVVSTSIQPPIQQQQQTNAAQDAGDRSPKAPVNERSDPNERIADYTWWLMWLTFTMAVATAGLWYIATKTARRQLRAYVLPEKCWLEDFTSDTPRFLFIAKNYGQTPASECDIWVSWRYRDQLPVVDLPTGPPPDLVMSSHLLGPQGFTTTTDVVYLDDERKQRLADGTAMFFVLGTITYKDIFRRPRTTKYCFACGGGYGLPSPGGGLYPRDDGNEAD